MTVNSLENEGSSGLYTPHNRTNSAFICAPAIFDTKLEDDPVVLKLEGEYEPRPVAKAPGPSEVEKAFRWAAEGGAFMRAHPEILELPEVQARLWLGVADREAAFQAGLAAQSSS